MSLLPPICERVRSQVSLVLDAEVSELDRRLVAAHLGRCAACRDFEASVRAFTEELRGAPLEQPRHPVVLRHVSRRISFSATQFGAAAMLLIAVLGLTQFAVPQPEGTTGRQPAIGNLFETAWQPELELAQLDDGSRQRATERPGPLPAL